MPREQINHPEFVNVDYTDDSPVKVPGLPNQSWIDSAVHVSWQPQGEFGAGHVQVSLEADQRYLDSVLCSARERPDVEGIPAEPTPFIWSPVLTRTECNAMIRALRRARDKAYGSDE